MNRPIHPCADVFPKLNEADLQRLADDIKANGLQLPIVLWSDGSVLDGRNRMEALSRNGADLSDSKFYHTNETENPAAFVISANIHRRHLTKDQQAELILKAVEAGPLVANSEVINMITSETTRRFHGGTTGGSTPDPVLAAAFTEAAKHGISKVTVRRARARQRKKTSTATKAPKTATPRKRPNFEHTRRTLNERIAQIADESLTQVAVGKRLKLGEIAVKYLIHEAQLLPWVTLTWIDAEHFTITINHELKNLCDLKRGLDILGGSLTIWYTQLRDEITRRRKEMSNSRWNRKWNPDDTTKVEQANLLDWIEDQLDSVADHVPITGRHSHTTRSA